MALQKGARVIGLASTPEKRTAAIEVGAETCFDYSEEWPKRIRSHAEGGFNAVFDSIGTTFLHSLSCLRDRGTLVAFGTAGGEPPQIDAQLLMDRSLAVVGGDLWNHLDSREARLDRAGRLFRSIRMGALKLPSIEQFALERGADAHRRMEDRNFFGKIVLTI